MSRYTSVPLIVALSPGHSDITRFRLWSPVATGNHLDGTEKNSKVVETTGTVDVLICIQAFWDPPHGELPHAHIIMNDGPNPPT